MKPIKTIGHSNHPIERFVDLLKAGGVERAGRCALHALVAPLPAVRPRAARRTASPRPASSTPTRARRWAASRRTGGSYDDLAARPDFKDALDRLIAGAADTTLCLMCAEKEPLDCHRTVLVSRRLAERGVAIEHLLADGRSEPHAAVEDRLLAASDGGGPDLFTTAEDRATRLARAWQARERAMKRA